MRSAFSLTKTEFRTLSSDFSTSKTLKMSICSFGVDVDDAVDVEVFL